VALHEFVQKSVTNAEPRPIVLAVVAVFWTWKLCTTGAGYPNRSEAVP
jgi:hypothetical protein